MFFRTPINSRSGYALPLTLAAIIVIALVASIAARQVNQSNATVSALSGQSGSQAAMISAEQTLIYLLLTESMRMDGITMGASSPLDIISADAPENSTTLIRANGQAHSLTLNNTPVIVRLYDDQSFFNLSSRNIISLERALLAYGVDPVQMGRMHATLSDYQDEDDLKRLGGAEIDDYPAIAPPVNMSLRDITQVCAINGWAESPVCEDRGRLLLTALNRRNDPIAPRLTSRAMLRLLLPSAQSAERAYERVLSGQTLYFDAIGRPDLDFNPDPLNTVNLPGPRMVLVTHAPDATRARRIYLELTMNNPQSPFVVHSKYVIGGDYAQSALRIESIDDVAPLPEPTSNGFERR